MDEIEAFGSCETLNLEASPCQHEDLQSTSWRESTPREPSPPQRVRGSNAGAQRSGQPSCQICQARHPLRVCRRFEALGPAERKVIASVHGYCLNCLALSPPTNSCASRQRCRKCGRAHHTMLHVESAVPPQERHPNYREDRRSNPNANPTSVMRAGHTATRSRTIPSRGNCIVIYQS